MGYEKSAPAGARVHVIVNVGIGFSKTAEDDLEVLRSAHRVTADCQVGPGPRSLCYI
jgi:hypothetical protein